MPSPRILAVDDSKSIREMLRVHLANAGYEVRIAADALEAGRMVLEDPPDLIITDLAMPYMDGTELIAALRADTTLPDIPIIVLTSRELTAPEVKALGVAAYLKKPVDATRLTELVAHHTRK